MPSLLGSKVGSRWRMKQSPLGDPSLAGDRSRSHHGKLSSRSVEAAELTGRIHNSSPVVAGNHPCQIVSRFSPSTCEANLFLAVTQLLVTQTKGRAF